MTSPRKVSFISGPNTGKYGPEITPYLETFHAVLLNCNWRCHEKKWKLSGLHLKKAIFKLENYIIYGSNTDHLWRWKSEVFPEAAIQRCSIKKGVLENFAKFTEKHLCQSLFFNKVAGRPLPATLLIKRLWRRCFPVDFTKFLRTPFLMEHLRWLLLNTVIF